MAIAIIDITTPTTGTTISGHRGPGLVDRLMIAMAARKNRPVSVPAEPAFAAAGRRDQATIDRWLQTS